MQLVEVVVAEALVLPLHVAMVLVREAGGEPLKHLEDISTRDMDHINVKLQIPGWCVHSGSPRPRSLQSSTLLSQLHVQNNGRVNMLMNHRHAVYIL